MLYEFHFVYQEFCLMQSENKNDEYLENITLKTCQCSMI